MSPTQRLTLSAAVALFVAASVHGQSILTVAGGGTDDGHPAADVALSGPMGLTFDSRGNLFFAENDGNVIRKIATDGTISTVAGNGGAGFGGDGGKAIRATLNKPTGVAVDTNGDIYIADNENNRIRKVDGSTGVITTFAGTGSNFGSIGDGGPAANAILSLPQALWLDRGSLYVSESFGGNRVRRIVLSTAIITTVVGATDGSSGSSGDGGPASAAKIYNPESIAVDSAGNLFIADTSNQRVRRVDAASLTIDTYAGGGTLEGEAAEGAAATDVKLSYPSGVAFDRAGNLLILHIGRLLKVDKSTRKVSIVTRDYTGSGGIAVAANGDVFTASGLSIERLPAGTSTLILFAGFGTYVGDGLPATAAVLRIPRGIAVDRQGNLFIADSYHFLVRKVDAKSGIMSTYAGGGDFPPLAGIPATEAYIGLPEDVAIDPQGNLYISEFLGEVYRVDAATGILTRYAGGGSRGSSNEGVPAIDAYLGFIAGIGLDRDANLYVALDFGDKVYRVDARTHLIATFAGTGKAGNSGDGGPAAAAQLDSPSDAEGDAAGNVYISDMFNYAIRRVGLDGNISTFAGNGQRTPPFGDGGPATQAFFLPGHIAVDGQRNDLYLADVSLSRVRKIEAQSRIISTIAGSSIGSDDTGFSGDNGPAKEAKMSFFVQDSGVAIDGGGNMFVADTSNNRIRSVASCVNVAAPSLTAPVNGASGTSTDPLLTWSAVAGGFRYDVALDTVSPPARVIAADLTSTSFTPANLQPNTKYFWSVTAKGDPFCPTPSKATSSINSFTTVGTCAAGTFDIASPAEGATNVAGSPLQLSWRPSSGAGSYDVYLGAANPPPLVARGVTATTYSTTVVDRSLFWFVVAHAACDDTKTASTPVHSFTTSVTRVCGAPGTVTTTAPASGASNVATTVDLTWTVSGGEQPDTFDLYFGTQSTPPLLRSSITGDTRSVSLSQLSTSTTYYWRLVGKGTCFGAGVSTPVLSFTTRSVCTAPGATQILFAPTGVGVGATYAIVWSVAAGLDADGGYLVERSTSASFSSILDAQVTSSTASSFLANAVGTYYHRVRALPSCDPTKSGPTSDVRSVAATNAPANVIFTVQPVAVVTALGEALEDKRATFALENIGSAPLQVVVGQAELPGSRPFFRVAEGGAFVTLLPRVPRTFTIEYSGPPNNVAASYQGLIFVAGLGQQLAITPYAFVNLKVGGGPSATPQLLVDGIAAEYVAFPGFAGDDDTPRAPREITIRNSGTTPMELAAEIGPEVWLLPEVGWNAQPLAAGASRTVKLFTSRRFSAAGSPLPRYTYLTIRTRDGSSARLLVQDNDRLPVSGGRATSLEVGARSFIVPEVVSQRTGAVTVIRLSNSGGDSVQVEMVFTPSGSDGFDAIAVKRAVVLVPPNDVVTLIDPLVQIFSAADGAFGQIEVRIPRERLGLIAVTASNAPVVKRGEGARVGAGHAIYMPGATGTAAVVLAETSGLDRATVRLGVTDAIGQVTTSTHDLARYGTKRISIGTTKGVAIDVDFGGGSVIGLATIESGGRTMNLLSRPVTERAAASSVMRAFSRATPSDTVSITTVVPMIGSSTAAGNAPSYRTSLGFVALSGVAATFNLSLYPASGAAVLTRSVPVPGGANLVINDAQRELFNLSNPTDGNLLVEGPPGAKVYAVLQSVTSSGAATPTSSIPLPTTYAEALTSAAGGAQRPLAYDGLEQSVDSSRGTRWLLLLNEVGGASGQINVRLYEATNRSRPIAEKDVSIAPNQQLKLDTVFAALGLDASDRRKDRTNVQVVVTATGGSARLAATAVSIDNKTGDTKMIQLQPSVGGGVPNVGFTAPVVPTAPAVPPRRRGVRH